MVDWYPPVPQVWHGVQVAPLRYVPLGHSVQTPLDLYAPDTHDVGQLVAVVPGPVYVPYALPLVQAEQAVATSPVLYVPVAHAAQVEVLTW